MVGADGVVGPSDAHPVEERRHHLHQKQPPAQLTQILVQEGLYLVGVHDQHGLEELLHPLVAIGEDHLLERGFVSAHHQGGPVPLGHGLGHELQEAEVIEVVAPVAGRHPHGGGEAVAALPHPDDICRQTCFGAHIADAQELGFISSHALPPHLRQIM